MNHRKGLLLLLPVFGASVLGACGSSKVTTTTTTTSKPATTTTTAAPTYVLTGLPVVAGGPSPTRPALMVKIDNAQPAWPQAGLDHADIIYEEMVEGGLTRYMAVFQSQDAPTVGPIRSIRATDADLAAQTTGLVGYSGGIPAFISDLRATGAIDVGVNLAPSAYHRDYSRPAPHNLYSSTTALYAAANGRGPTPHALFDFGPPTTTEPLASSNAVAAFTIVISGATIDTWTHDAAGNQWTKAINGIAMHNASGTPLGATNVIIEYVPYVATGFIDPAGNPVPEAQLVGSGSAEIAFGGRVATGQWSKTSPSAAPVYTYSNGQPVKLLPGRTWVIFAPVGASFTSQP